LHRIIHFFSFGNRYDSAFGHRTHSQFLNKYTENVAIEPVFEIAKLILSNDLANRQGHFIKWKSRFHKLVKVFGNEKHPDIMLTVGWHERMVGEGYHNLWMRSGTMEAAKALIVKHSLNNDTYLILQCYHMPMTHALWGES
jgi:hypothetical protein